MLRKHVGQDVSAQRLGEEIRQFHELTGVPFRRVLEYAGLNERSGSCMWNIERKNRIPSANAFGLVCEYIGVSPDYVLGYSDEKEYRCAEGSGDYSVDRVGELTRELLKRQKTTDVVRGSGISYETIMRLASGSMRQLRVETVCKLADYIGITYELATGMRRLTDDRR